MTKTKRWLAGGMTACALLLALMTMVPGALAQGLDEEALSELGLGEAEYEAAREEVRVAVIEEAAAGGWLSEDEAAALLESGRSLRLGRGWYYDNIFDKQAMLAEALGVSVADLEAAKQAAEERHLAERVADGRLSETEAADRLTVRAFKESLDSDALLAQALNISVAALNEARAANTHYDDLLAELDIDHEAARAAQAAVMADAVQAAVDAGTLTTEQAELMESGACNGRHGRRNRTETPGGGIAPPADSTA